MKTLKRNLLKVMAAALCLVLLLTACGASTSVSSTGTQAGCKLVELVRCGRTGRQQKSAM